MSSEFLNNLINYLYIIPCALIALSFHEFAHGWMANRLGDHTARNFGRLTLNPLKHLDILGTLCMIFFRFGWAKPVPVNSRYFKNPRRDMALTAAAGPIMNFILAFIGLLFYHIILAFFIAFSPSSSFASNIGSTAIIFFGYFTVMNLSLGVFNLLPLPPLDGSRIFYVFLPEKIYFGIMKYERYIQFAILILLYLGLLDTPLNYIVDHIYSGMNWLIELIPIFRL